MKNTVKQLKIKYEKELKLINQPVSIRDIFVYSETKVDDPDIHRHRLTLGENLIESADYKGIDLFKRLQDHINLLANIAARTHERYNYHLLLSAGSKFTIRPDCQNNITRIATSEFSFYTPNPLTLQQLANFIEGLESLAKKYYSNIHLLLSSFAVVTDDQTVLNLCLYVQCGENPTITCFTKSMASQVDITFAKTKLFEQRSMPWLKPRQFTAEINSGFVISNQGIIEVITLGGARFTLAVDICLEHYYGHAQEVLSGELKRPDLNTSFFPHQIDHIVTANFINIFQNKTLTQSTVLVDPRKSKAFMPKPSSIDNGFLGYVDLKLPSAYKTSIVRTDPTGELTLYNPPFGPSTRVILHKQRELGRLHPSLQVTADSFNCQTIIHLVVNVLRSNSPEGIFFQKKHAGCFEFIHEMNKTISQFESKVNSGFLSIFSLTAQVRSYIKEFIENLPPFNSETEIFIKEFSNVLIDFKNKLAKTSNGCHIQKHFINSIITKIEQLQKVLSLEMVSRDVSVPHSLALD